jgi:hypothetical protein
MFREKHSFIPLNASYFSGKQFARETNSFAKSETMARVILHQQNFVCVEQSIFNEKTRNYSLIKLMGLYWGQILDKNLN